MRLATSRYGYTCGVFDLYHPGHVELLRRARSRCDHLTVGLTTDQLARAHKTQPPIMTYDERAAVLGSVRFVDSVVPQTNMDKFEAWQRLRFDVLFVGDDWRGTPEWVRYERKLAKVGVPVVYLPYTRTVSSTEIRGRL